MALFTPFSEERPLKETPLDPVVAHCQFSAIGGDLSCPLCGAKVSSGRGHACSRRRDGTISSREALLSFVCLQCLMRFETAGELNSHIVGCRPELALEECASCNLPSSLATDRAQMTVLHDRAATRRTPKRPSLSNLDGERS